MTTSEVKTEEKSLSNLEILDRRPDIALAIQRREITLTWHESDPPRPELRWPEVGGDKPVSLDDSDALWSWATVQKAMLKTWRVVTIDMTPRDWHALLALLTARAEVIPEYGASMDNEVIDMLDSWIQSNLSPSWSGHNLHSMALFRDGFYYFRIEAFERGALFNQNSRFYYQRYLVPRSKLWGILKSVGGQSTAPRFRKRTIRVWQLPEDFNQPAPGEPEGQLELEEEAESGEESGE
jgi:hypothetical protein